MIVSAEKMFEFAWPNAFVAIVNSAQSNEMSMDCAAANSEMDSAANSAESGCLFTVTENDFAQMARFDQCVRQLKDYLGKTSYYVDAMKMQQQEAMAMHGDLGGYVKDVDMCNSRYFELCSDMRDFCVLVDKLTQWYVSAVDEVAGLLKEVSAAGFKYANLTEAFAKAGKDIGVVERFFDRWSAMVRILVIKSERVEDAFRLHYECCNNELPKKFQGILTTMEHLNMFIMQNQCFQVLAVVSAHHNDVTGMALGLKEEMEHYGDVVRIMRGLKNELEHGGLSALDNMIIYLSHIGTYYNGISGNIHSTRNWLLNANDAKSVRTAAEQLSYSKAAWLACEDASQRFVRVSAEFIR